ncbi:hypothetical protein [Glycomyces arizonensis]|uniref:hypothetical protein n=1 Tax=Glycomyces arizonensis TaxID=256035 RepID=UPI000411CBCD|nr:hypothetical protein [Glycomyces arizonensis]
MTSTTIRYPVLPENHHEFARVYPPGFGPGEPYYEPDHLRHRPGDTFEIGGRPHDPQDPGAYGTPGWYQDRRTGRHRRNELPDPLPPEAEKPRPGRHRRFWVGPDAEAADRYADDFELSFGFTALQEDAWERWLIDSEPLAAAHTTRSAAVDRESRTAAFVVRLVQWIVAVFAPSADEEEEQHRKPSPSAPPLPAPRTGNGYISTFELNFDAQHPATGGGVL